MKNSIRSLTALALLLPSFSSAVPHANGNGASPETPFLPARSSSSSSSSNNGTTTSHVDAFPAGLHMAVDWYPEAWVDEPEKKNNDTQSQKDAGLSYIRIGEFMWSTIEPQDGVYNWTLLDQAIEEVGSKGMKVILGTPTATPPRWASKKYDIYGADAEGKNRVHGSRRHYSFSSPDYQKLSRRITEALAKRYGANEHVGAVQLDNEFGCHGTVRTYDQHAQKAFQQWLQKKYKDVQTMNTMQGNKFWSQEYDTFEDVPLPTMQVTENNPALRLDFYDFSSDQVIAFAKDQADAWKKHRKVNQPITTNLMGYFLDFDHFKLQKEAGLDFATWDSYPLGNTEQFAWIDDATKVKYARQGRPDAQAWHHELYKSVAGYAKNSTAGTFGLMEFQPGPVNWAPVNPSPLKGMVRIYYHETFAHGGSMTNIFRWREASYAQEQMHTAMFRRDNSPDQAFVEQQQVATEDLPKMLEAGLLKEEQTETGTAVAFAEETPKTRVAIVHDYYSQFVLESNPQGGTWDTNTFTGVPFIWNQLNGYYHTALRRLGYAVDVIGPDQNLNNYDLVVVPSMPYITANFEKRLNAYNGSIVFGPRSASKVQTLSIPDGLPPAKGVVRDRLPIYVERVESLRTDMADKVSFDGKQYPVAAWAEWVQCARNGQNTTMPVEATFSGYRDGEPATCAHKTEDGRVSRYVAYYGDADFLTAYLAKVASEAGVQNMVGKVPSASDDLGADLRFARQGKALFAFNYGPEAVQVPASFIPEGASVVIGDASSVPSAGMSVWKLP